MTILSRALRAVLCGVIRSYQLFLSPILPVSCRYAPSCSSYAMEAISTHGVLKGCWMAARRIGRCHPWGGKGYDPVPEAPHTVSRTK